MLGPRRRGRNSLEKSPFKAEEGSTNQAIKPFNLKHLPVLFSLLFTTEASSHGCEVLEITVSHHCPGNQNYSGHRQFYNFREWSVFAALF